MKIQSMKSTVTSGDQTQAGSASAHDIAFLHTAQIHVATFQHLVDTIKPGLEVRHVVDDALLADAIADGITPALKSRIESAMNRAADTGSPVIVCTCSTIGGIAEQHVIDGDVVCQRIDRAMADEAVTHHQRILVVAAVQSTLEPTRQLLQQSCERFGLQPDIDVQLIDSAWAHFESGDLDQYYRVIADYIHTNGSSHDCAILAQASMSGVVKKHRSLLGNFPVYASPELGVRAALAGLA